MTPRRSSRARTTQPSPALLQHTNSSSSASSSIMRERNTRSNHKTTSPHRSSHHRSQSIDEGGAGSTRSDFPQTRQRQRARASEAHGREDEAVFDDEDAEEEEEVTRCLCGQQDYPGLPPSRREALGLASGGREDAALNLPTDSSELLPDELGSMFIQCDSCKVWQHGGCVGIMDEAMSPDEYFCEECRKDLHRIRSEPNGQRSSQYLPVAPASPPPASSRESSRETSRRARDSKSRQSDTLPNPKRRSTMNSREAAYDEEEQLRRAIEESKEETKISPDGLASRRGKRSRSDSEVGDKQVTKRQRTGSPSPTTAAKQSNPASESGSEDETSFKAAVNGLKRPQRTTARDQRDKNIKETEAADAGHLDPFDRRKGRSSDRRKGEESENDTGSPTKPNINEPEPEQTSPATSVPPPEPTPARPALRKSGRPPTRRGNRVGRNQYTRDRDINGNATDSNNSPRRGQSHDGGAGGDSPRVGSVNGFGHAAMGESGKPSRPRHMNPQRTTMNEMKRRVAAILEFISRMQVEMAAAGGGGGGGGGESSSTPVGNGNGNGNGHRDRANANGALLRSVAEHLESILPSTTASDAGDFIPTTESEGSVTATGEHAPPQLQFSREKDFKDLSSVEMMDVLTRHLLKWQQEYGKFGEK